MVGILLCVSNEIYCMSQLLIDPRLVTVTSDSFSFIVLIVMTVNIERPDFIR